MNEYTTIRVFKEDLTYMRKISNEIAHILHKEEPFKHSNKFSDTAMFGGILFLAREYLDKLKKNEK